MLTLSEFIDLRDKLVNSEIGLESAKAACWSDLKKDQRSWQSKDWKERRAKVIKEACEVCGSKETLTLQHGSHPRKFTYFVNEVTKKYTDELIRDSSEIDAGLFTYYVKSNYEYYAVPLCPICNSRKPNRRMRKVPLYYCTKCHSEFDETENKTIEELVSIFYENEDATEVRDKCFVTKDNWRNKHNLSSVRYWMQRKQAKERNTEVIEREAFLLYLEDTIKYLSFNDTVTACRKCAYNFDINNLEPCPSCNVYYKGLKYPTCIQCLPDDKREVALKKVEFVKEMNDMHKELGID